MSVVENDDSIDVSPPLYNDKTKKFEFEYRHPNDTPISSSSSSSYPDILIHNPLELFQQENAKAHDTNGDIKHGDGDNDDVDFIPCLGILNQKINLPISNFTKLWNNSVLKVCADGGANQLYNYILTNSLDPKDYVPDFIIGDLDSIKQKVINYYSSQNVPIKLQSSQYFTDLDKLISIINLSVNCPGLKDLDSYNDIDDLEMLENSEIINSDNNESFQKILLYLIGSIGGRFDQTIHSINQLIKNNSKRKNFRFFLFNSNYNEIIVLLNKGYNFIHLKNKTKSHTDNGGDHDGEEDGKESLVEIGLLPLYKPTKISTHGLKWDVHDWETCWGGNISSSNLLVGNSGFYVYSKDNPIFLNISY
ncbi:unnamed protein product [[Candida] boidinii]|uniref:Unnamed protein product n=1 Tax=Candida boidinii TaxID=5477 RepID=A0A9W6T393_CANBO|nr:binding protein [[Candida] boidinii]GME76201.1 unnamed protein product [[Candida] boidinii]